MDPPESPGPTLQIVAQGYLSKRKKAGLKEKKKYYVMTQRRLKKYNTKEEFDEGLPWAGCTDLMDVQAVRKLDSRGSSRNSFEIVTESKQYAFQADSPEELTRWVAGIRKILGVRFSSIGELYEHENETKEIESQLEKRKSKGSIKKMLSTENWRSSRIKSEIRRSKSIDSPLESDAMGSFDFLNDQEKQNDGTEEEGNGKDEVMGEGQEKEDDKGDEDVFETDLVIKPTTVEEEEDVRPVSSSSGVDTLSTETGDSAEDKDLYSNLAATYRDSTYSNIPLRSGLKVELDKDSAFSKLKEMLGLKNSLAEDDVDVGSKGTSAVEKLKQMIEGF